MSRSSVTRAVFRSALLGGAMLALPGCAADPVSGEGWRVPLTGPLIADRPGFSTSPQTVARGHLQLEGGYQFTRDNEGDNLDQHAFPSLLARAGVLDNVELRVSWSGVVMTEVDGHTDTDFSDTSLGAKATLFEQDGLRPTLGLLGEVSVPTGSGDASSDTVDPTLGVLWTYDLAQGPGLFGTFLGSSITDDDDDRVFQGAAAVGAGFSLTDRLGSFIEYFGIFTEDSDPSHNADGGFTYLVNDNLQLDINGGLGLNEDADDFFVGAGVAWRL